MHTLLPPEDAPSSQGTDTLLRRETEVDTAVTPHESTEQEDQVEQVESSEQIATSPGVTSLTDKVPRGKWSFRRTPDFVPRRSKRVSATTEDEEVTPLRRTLSRMYSSFKNAVVSTVSAGNGDVQQQENDEEEAVCTRTPRSVSKPAATLSKAEKKPNNAWHWLTSAPITTPSGRSEDPNSIQIANFFGSAIPIPPGEPGAFAERATQLCLKATTPNAALKSRTLEESDETSMWEWLGTTVNVKGEAKKRQVKKVVPDTPVVTGDVAPKSNRDGLTYTSFFQSLKSTPRPSAATVQNPGSVSSEKPASAQTRKRRASTQSLKSTPRPSEAAVQHPASAASEKPTSAQTRKRRASAQSLKSTPRPSVAVVQHPASAASEKSASVQTRKGRASTTTRLSAKVKFTLPCSKETSGGGTNSCKKRRVNKPPVITTTSQDDPGKDVATNPEDDDDESWNIADSECSEIPTNLITVDSTVPEPVKEATLASIEPKDRVNEIEESETIPTMEQDVTENSNNNNNNNDSDDDRPMNMTDSYDASIIDISNLDDPIAALAHAVALVASQEELYPSQATLNRSSIAEFPSPLEPSPSSYAKFMRGTERSFKKTKKAPDYVSMPPPPVPSSKFLSGKQNTTATNLFNHRSENVSEKDSNEWEPPIANMDCVDEPCDLGVAADEQSVALAKVMSLVAGEMGRSFEAEAKWTTPARDENKKTTSSNQSKRMTLRRKHSISGMEGRADAGNGTIEDGRVPDLPVSPLMPSVRSIIQVQTPALASASKSFKGRPSKEHRISTRSSDVGTGSGKVSKTDQESTPTMIGRKGTGQSNSMELLPSSGKSTGSKIQRSGSINRGTGCSNPIELLPSPVRPSGRKIQRSDSVNRGTGRSNSMEVLPSPVRPSGRKIQRSGSVNRGAGAQPPTTSFTPSPSPAIKDDLAPSASKKSYIRSGLYSTDLKSQSSTPSLSLSKRKAKKGGKRSPLLPLPIEYGTLLLTQEQDFRLPYDIANDWARGLLIPPEPAYEPYQIIRSNIFVERKPRKSPEVAVCHCVPPEDGGPSCAEDCINRMVYYECIEEHCPCGSQCTNRRLQRRERVSELDVFWTQERGHGLRTLVPIKKGQLILEYRGEVISQKECINRMETRYANKKNYYFLEYGQGEVLDAGEKGTEARFVNHSCDPNCHIEKWSVQDGEIRVGLFASEEIPGGSELYYDYNFENFPGAAEQQCLCGSIGCRGVIGQRRHDLRENGNKKSMWKKKGKATKRDGTNGECLSFSAMRLTLGERRRKGAQSSWLAKNIGFLREHRPFLLRNVRNVVAKAAMKKVSRPTTDRPRETGTPFSRWKGNTRNNDVITQLENVQADLVTCRERRRGLALRRMRPFKEIMNNLSTKIQIDTPSGTVFLTSKKRIL